jgi:hypothetical protein
MLRTYQHDPRSKKYMKPNQNYLKNVIMAIKSKQVTYREAQEIYGIHYSVLYRHVKFIIFKLQFMLYSYQFIFVKFCRY